MDVAAMTLNAERDGWLALLRTRVQPTTHRSYDDMIHSELRPLLGECLVGELTVHQCNLHLVHLLQQGGRRGGPLTPKTVHDAHAILRQALGEAVRDGLLADNVAERAAPPRHEQWPLMFTRPDGLPWRPEMITDRWRRQWPRLELPKLTLHSLRHCHARRGLTHARPPTRGMLAPPETESSSSARDHELFNAGLGGTAQQGEVARDHRERLGMGECLRSARLVVASCGREVC